MNYDIEIRSDLTIDIHDLDSNAKVSVYNDYTHIVYENWSVAHFDIKEAEAVNSGIADKLIAYVARVFHVKEADVRRFIKNTMRELKIAGTTIWSIALGSVLFILRTLGANAVAAKGNFKDNSIEFKFRLKAGGVQLDYKITLYEPGTKSKKMFVFKAASLSIYCNTPYLENFYGQIRSKPEQYNKELDRLATELLLRRLSMVFLTDVKEKIKSLNK